MRHLLIGLLLLACLPLAQAQDVEAMAPLAKKKKYRRCVGTRTYVSKETGEASAPHKSHEWHFGADGQVEAYEHYADTDSLQVRGRHRYDAQGRRVLTEEDNLHIGEHERLEYAYDAQGRLLEKRDMRDGKLLVTYRYYYGAAGRLDSLVWLDGSGRPELREYYEYDGQGRLVAMREENGDGRADGRTELRYHADGTLEEEVLYDGFGNVFERMYYTAEGWLRRREVSYIDYEVVYEYFYGKKGLLLGFTKAKSGDTVVERVALVWGRK
jgi:YD repeat-containing protein